MRTLSSPIPAPISAAKASAARYLSCLRLDEILQSRPADLAGIKEGDIVTEFDGIPIRTPEEFRWRVRRALPYSTVKVVVVRGTETLEILVKMGKQ